MNTELLPEIDRFLAKHEMSDYRFGYLAVRNGRLVERLRNGGRVWPETVEAVRQFMQEKEKGAAA